MYVCVCVCDGHPSNHWFLIPKFLREYTVEVIVILTDWECILCNKMRLKHSNTPRCDANSSRKIVLCAVLFSSKKRWFDETRWEIVSLTLASLMAVSQQARDFSFSKAMILIPGSPASVSLASA